MVSTLMPILASAILTTSVFTSCSQQPKGFVASYTTPHAVSVAKQADDKPKIVQIPQVTTIPQPVVQPDKQTGFEEVYKSAGSRYNVPWQILYGIHMTETGGRNGVISSGYGTGAQGPMQFMPGTWKSYGVDGDGDGKADINDANDAIYTAANYLAAHGTLDQGLKAYGGNYNGILAQARSRGFEQ